MGGGGGGGRGTFFSYTVRVCIFVSYICRRYNHLEVLGPGTAHIPIILTIVGYFTSMHIDQIRQILY